MKFSTLDKFVRTTLVALIPATLLVSLVIGLGAHPSPFLAQMVGTGRKPLVMVSGQTEQLPTADYLTSVGGASFNSTPPTAAGDVEASTIGINTSGQVETFSTYIGANSNGLNIWIGGGGTHSFGSIGDPVQGAGNTSEGYNSLLACTTCAENTSAGAYSMWQSLTTRNSTGTGYGSLYNILGGTYETATGYEALFSDTAGVGNTAHGWNALYDLNITDENSGWNTAIGADTGRGILDGVNNTILGARVTGLDPHLSNTVIIADGLGEQRFIVDSTGAAKLAGSVQIMSTGAKWSSGSGVPAITCAIGDEFSRTGDGGIGTTLYLCTAINTWTAVAASNSRSLGIVGIGDSHTNGQVPGATISGAETLGAVGNTSPKDEQWNGTAVNVPFIANNQINSISGTTDPNVGLSTTNGTYLSWIPSLLRASYPSLNKIRIANLGVGGASAYTWAGEQASGYVGGLLAPNDGDTVTIAGVTYTFRNAPAVANDVLVGTATGSVLNLCNAVNAEGTGWGAGTVVNPLAMCPNPTAATYGHFFALTPGTGGNALTISSSNLVRVTAVNGSLVPTSPASMTQGSNTSALYANGKTALNGGAGFGTVDIFVITLGTNDAGRPGDRGREFQAGMTTLIANIKTDYPSAKIIIWKPIVNTIAATNTAITNTILPAVTALVAADPTHVSMVDMNVLGVGSANVLILGTNGVHATYYGYQLLAQLFATKIATLLGL